MDYEGFVSRQVSREERGTLSDFCDICENAKVFTLFPSPFVLSFDFSLLKYSLKLIVIERERNSLSLFFFIYLFEYLFTLFLKLIGLKMMCLVKFD